MSKDKLNEHESRGRGVYPHAGVEELRPLNELHDFRVVDGEPDIRGWHVLDMDGGTMGKVHDLLVDTAAMKVRYMDVEVAKALLDDDEHRHILVPIGMARLDDDNDEVRLGQLSQAQLLTMPAYRNEQLDREQERTMLGLFGTLGQAATAGTLAGELPEHNARPAGNEGFYDQPYFNDAGLRRRKGDARANRPGAADGTADSGTDATYFTRF